MLTDKDAGEQTAQARSRLSSHRGQQNSLELKYETLEPILTKAIQRLSAGESMSDVARSYAVQETRSPMNAA